MRRLALLLLLLLALPAAHAQDLYDYGGLTLRLGLNDTLIIVPQGSRSSVDYVTADLSWFPRETYRQQVTGITTAPPAADRGSVWEYRWEQPRSTALTLGLSALVRTSAAPLPVRDTVPYPITTMPQEVAHYTEFGQLIDVDDAIRQQAFALAGTKDDLFEVVYTVADWVTTRIAYNLTTLTADATEPSTWVMANRQGVCDEMTALFISMLRSLGIPARFVSGVSYTNLPEFASPWGGHGWAEVWFPDAGWVPFDVTYGTYGYVDATHIKLQDSFDAAQSSVDYTMRARQASLITQSLLPSVEVLGTEPRQGALFSATLTPFDDVALDSYDLLTATVTNLKPYYVSARFQLAQTEGLELLGDPVRNILLRPRETQRIRYVIRTKGLRPGFRYEFPVRLYAGQDEVANASFAAREGLPRYGLDFFRSYLNDGNATGEERNARLACAPEPPAAYVGGNVTAVCTLANDGSALAGGFTACLDGCERLAVPSGGNATFRRTFACATPGVKAALATAQSSLAAARALVRYECMDPASVNITVLHVPAALGFDESGEILFAVARQSDTIPQNLTVTVAHDNFRQEWTMAELLQPQRFAYTLGGRDLDLSGNTVTLTVAYRDRLGARYETHTSLVIRPRDFTFWERVQVDLLNAERWLESLG